VKYHYSDSMIVLSGAERERAATSRVFVEEDCSSMSLSQLATRIEAVAAGDDKVAQYLHARYARKRMDAEHARVDELRRRGGNETLPEGELMARRRLIDLVEDLEGKVSSFDETTATRRKRAQRSAQESRATAERLRRRLMEADGTDANARQDYRERMNTII
jgi:hypothetical protein